MIGAQTTKSIRKQALSQGEIASNAIRGVLEGIQAAVPSPYGTSCLVCVMARRWWAN